MTREQFNAIKAKSSPVKTATKTMTRSQFNAIKQPKVMTRAEFEAKSQPQSGGAFNWTMNQLVKPVSAASNLLEDAGKTIGYGVAKLGGYQGSFEDARKKLDIDPLKHLKDVATGENKRTYSDITNDLAKKEDNVALRAMMRTTGYGGDFLLDPLNKVKIAGLTAKGLAAEKTGKMALSVAQQAKKGQRALLQLGKWNVLPSVGNRVLSATTKINDVARTIPYVNKAFTAGAAVSGKIRPLGVGRDEFKVLTEAKTAARNTMGYTKDKAIEFAKGLQKTLVSKKATDTERAALLNAIEKGDKMLAPKKFKDLFKQGVAFKKANEETWKKLGGDTLEGYGLAHVATPEVAEQARKDAFKGQGGFKLTSTKTPQDIHRQWMKVDGKITNIEKAGIKYDPVKGWIAPGAVETEAGNYINKFKPVNVSQASAQEINEALVKQGKNAIFQEDLPIVAAKMGISTGRKQAAKEFIEATKSLKSEEAIALANEVHNKMVNPESLRKAIEMFDAVQNVWKAQALVAPSYHIRNIAGNLWNNFLADVKTPAYAIAGKLQTKMKLGKLTAAEKKLVMEMEQHGIIGTGQYGGDIAKEVGKELGKTSYINPFSQKFAGYRANRWLGSGVEDNAKIAHYLSKRAEGYGVKQAAESVKKFLFDYGDLTDVERGVLKRVMPFYTWTSKNIPLQIQQFVNNPGKFSKIATTKKNVEQGVAQPDEKYMSDYMRGNAPIRVKTDKDGNTLYFLAGAWLPAAQAFSFLSNPKQNMLGMVTPAAKLPYENLTGKGTFFQNTLGEYEDIQKFPGQKQSYLGLDMNPQTVNNLRSLRALNELNNLNPGGIFGGKNSPSIWQGILPNASNVRGGQNTPETSQMDRTLNAFIGKLQGYNPEQGKTYYDKDTQNKVTEYNASINRALSNNQTELAGSIIKEMEQFVQERDGKPNEALQMYNLIGDQYFKDQATNKQAEKSRDKIREEMRQKIRDGFAANDTNAVREALKMDPSYAKQAVSDAIKEKSVSQQTDAQKKAAYELEQAKKKYKLNPFYK